MDRQPTIEQRIDAAVALAGLTNKTLADKIATTGYGDETLRRIRDPKDPRRAEPKDLYLIEQACNVSPAFWIVDFATLDVPNAVRVTEELARLRHEMDVVLRIIRVRLGTLLSEPTASNLELERPEDPEDGPTSDPPG